MRESCEYAIFALRTFGSPFRSYYEIKNAVRKSFFKETGRDCSYFQFYTSIRSRAYGIRHRLSISLECNILFALPDFKRWSINRCQQSRIASTVLNILICDWDYIKHRAEVCKKWRGQVFYMLY